MASDFSSTKYKVLKQQQLLLVALLLWEHEGTSGTYHQSGLLILGSTTRAILQLSSSTAMA